MSLAGNGGEVNGIRHRLRHRSRWKVVTTMMLLLFLFGFSPLLFRELAIQFRFGDLDQLGHERVKLT